MKKKTKLIGAIFALCTSLCMLCFGVMAASSVSLNVSSTVSFSAQGVYLKAQGQVKRGANAGSLSNLVGDTYSYTGYSYNPDENGAPDGTVYTQTAMRDDAGSTSGWNIGEVEFTENEKVLQYEIVFTNYSEFDVEITITPTTAGTLTNVTTSSQTAEKVTVSAKSGQTPGTKTYTFTMTLNNVATSQSGTVGLNISAVRHEVITIGFNIFNDAYITANVNSNSQVKQGDYISLQILPEHLYSWSINLILYDSQGQQIQQWGDFSTSNLYVEVPEIEEGYYFVVKTVVYRDTTIIS